MISERARRNAWVLDYLLWPTREPRVALCYGPLERSQQIHPLCRLECNSEFLLHLIVIRRPSFRCYGSANRLDDRKRARSYTAGNPDDAFRVILG